MKAKAMDVSKGAGLRVGRVVLPAGGPGAASFGRAWFLSVALGLLVAGWAPEAAAQSRLTRGPYLQLPTPGSIQVRWRTDVLEVGEVRYGTNPANLDLVVAGSVATNRHALTLTSLRPDTLYYYSVGRPGGVLTNGPGLAFRTPPPDGARQPLRIWVLGDSGFTNQFAGAVRDAYQNFTGTRRTDVWLMLGDNAYNGGTDGLYQNAVFDTYPALLRQTPLWSTIGNQETAGSANPPGTIAYFEIFSFPMSGEAGGEPSGTEKYYSFNHGNVHFICLDSMSSARTAGSPMLRWLEADLARNTSDWTIAFWHHPPYSKGNRDSDVNLEQIEMRANAVAMLEAYGVDLVFAGHCHSYERSYLIDGHYGLSSTFAPSHLKDGGDGRVGSGGTGAYGKATLGPAAHEGAVYVVAGSGSSTNGGPFNHPVMRVSKSVPGSVVLDVEANRLDLRFLRETGAVEDQFTLIKGAAAPRLQWVSGADGAWALEWNAVAGRHYQVEFAGALSASGWSNAGGPVRADGVQARWPLPSGGPGTNRFWRVRSLED